MPFARAFDFGAGMIDRDDFMRRSQQSISPDGTFRFYSNPTPLVCHLVRRIVGKDGPAFERLALCAWELFTLVVFLRATRTERHRDCSHGGAEHYLRIDSVSALWVRNDSGSGSNRKSLEYEQ